MNKRWFKWVFVLTVFLFIGAVFSLSIGSVSIPFRQVLALLFGIDTGGGHSATGGIYHTILFDIRLPRILLALAVGGALSVSGVLLQGMFRNPLVEPYTLGISGGAALGVSLSIVFGLNRVLGNFSLSVSGFIGALLVILFVWTVAMKKGALKIQSVLLTGVMISFILSSLILLIMALSRTEDLHGIVFWIMGSLQGHDWFFVKLALVISFAGLIISYFFCFKLNALSVGEEAAMHLGIDVEKTKKGLFILASILTGMSVSVAGIIGFIGLVVPHFVRMFISSDHRFLLISSFILGGGFLILCDTLARTIASPIELPVGVITGLIGGVGFVYALMKLEK